MRKISEDELTYIRDQAYRKGYQDRGSEVEEARERGYERGKKEGAQEERRRLLIEISNIPLKKKEFGIDSVVYLTRYKKEVLKKLGWQYWPIGSPD